MQAKTSEIVSASVKTEEIHSGSATDITIVGANPSAETGAITSQAYTNVLVVDKDVSKVTLEGVAELKRYTYAPSSKSEGVTFNAPSTFFQGEKQVQLIPVINALASNSIPEADRKSAEAQFDKLHKDRPKPENSSGPTIVQHSYVIKGATLNIQDLLQPSASSPSPQDVSGGNNLTPSGKPPTMS